jgi:hypothetical protein
MIMNEKGLNEAAKAAKRAPGPLGRDYRPPVSTLPGAKAVALPGQLTIEDAEREADDDDRS